jgi:hypothetical protein
VITNDARRAVKAALDEYDLEKAVAIVREEGAARHVDEDGFTLLHHAVFAESLELVNALLADGAAVNAKTPDGARPLDLVATLLMVPGGVSSTRSMERIGVCLAANGGESKVWSELYAVKESIQREIAAEAERTKREIDEYYRGSSDSR